MTKYLVDPIAVEEFDRKFRASKGILLDGCTFVSFKQTPTRWHATYQNDETSMEFSGSVSGTRNWMANQ